MEVAQGNINDSDSNAKSKLKFLIVEDDFASFKLLEDYLCKYGNSSFAVNGADGVEAFRKALDEGQPYDVICLDIMMPGMNGHLVLEEIGQIEAERQISDSDCVTVIMTTAIDDSEDMIKAFKEGCKAYIVKPITFERLKTEMQKLSIIE